MKCPYCGRHCIEKNWEGCYCEFCGARFSREEMEEYAYIEQQNKRTLEKKKTGVIILLLGYVAAFLLQFFFLQRDPSTFNLGYFGLLAVLPVAYGLFNCFSSDKRLLAMQEKCSGCGYLYALLLFVLMFPLGIIFIIIGTPSLRQLRLYGVLALVYGMVLIFFPLIVVFLWLRISLRVNKKNLSSLRQSLVSKKLTTICALL